MEWCYICGLILITITTTSVCSQSIVTLADRQHQLTVDILTHFSDQLLTTQHNLIQQIKRLEARIEILESQTAAGGVRAEQVPGEPEEVHVPVESSNGGDKGVAKGHIETEAPVTHAVTTTTTTTTQAPPTTTKPVTFAKFPEYEATCQFIYENDYTTSGEYTIDPDGFGANDPFTVYCDMDNGKGITMVGHDTETENILVNGFEDPGSFMIAPRYGNDITMEQLGALADASLECEQYVKYNCRNSGLMEISKRTGSTYAYWLDRNGRKRVNWGGAPTDSGLCACGAANPSTCFKGSRTCNCDGVRAKNQIDEGVLNDKSTLPVMTLNLGDTGSKNERGAVTLGKFVCKG